MERHIAQDVGKQRDRELDSNVPQVGVKYLNESFLAGLAGACRSPDTFQAK